MVSKPLQKLDSVRLEKGESFKTMESALGISDSTLCRWFAGKSEPTISELRLLADHFGVPLATLFDDDERGTLSAVHADQAAAFLAGTFRRLHPSADTTHNDMLAHHEAMLQAQAGLHKQLLDQQSHHYNVVVDYLKQQVRNFRLTAIIFLVLFIASLCFTVFITVADIPELGAGGTIAPTGATPLGFIRLITIPLLVLLLVAVSVVLIGDRRKHSSRKTNTEKEGA